ncbi:hypothetical protein BDS110ZK12_63860 [Bradyrhizobium diazoefficiens]|uniref:Uncharacterized protein n=1 Tax=Bradyrhizobium diazoefficiens TaxID=1355477 RepID=A0A810BG40_9BRAD|nr:hypothetical protein XF8B_58070 [Bradyrhizobium diazoefficiens]
MSDQSLCPLLARKNGPGLLQLLRSCQFKAAVDALDQRNETLRDVAAEAGDRDAAGEHISRGCVCAFRRICRFLVLDHSVPPSIERHRQFCCPKPTFGYRLIRHKE